MSAKFQGPVYKTALKKSTLVIRIVRAHVPGKESQYLTHYNNKKGMKRERGKKLK